MSIVSSSVFGHPARSSYVDTRRPGSVERGVALLAVIFFAPLFALINLAIVFGSSGPVFVSVPYRRRDGRVVYLTEFRTSRSFDTETYDRLAASPEAWTTRVGATLRFAGVARLPVLFDVRAGRVGLVEGLLR